MTGKARSNRVGSADQIAQAALPVLAARYAMPVYGRVKAGEPQSRIQLVREPEIVAAVGDKDVELVVLQCRLGHDQPRRQETEPIAWVEQGTVLAAWQPGRETLWLGQMSARAPGVSEYASDEDCAELTGAEPHAPGKVATLREVVNPSVK
jgi:hypothetical protein